MADGNLPSMSIGILVTTVESMLMHENNFPTVSPDGEIVPSSKSQPPFLKLHIFSMVILLCLIYGVRTYYCHVSWDAKCLGARWMHPGCLSALN